ncbi:MAG: MFS transporter [Hyphomicrobiales bacterium]|nr:MFS transporter [Hyphomicrobiales bacterium]
MDAFSIGRRRAAFAAAASGYVLSQFYRSFLTVVVDDLARDLGIGPKEFAALGAAWFLAFALSQFPVGMALDRLGPRRTMAALMLVAVAGALLFALAGTHHLALVAMALIGIGCAPILMGALYFLARTEAPARFAMLGSLFLSCGLVGSLIAATPMAALVQAIGWRAAMALVALATLASAFAVWIAMRDPPRETGAGGGSLVGDLLALLRLPLFWPILVMSFAISAPVFTERALWVGPFFGEVHGLGPIERGNAALALAVAMTASALLAGPAARLLDNAKAVVFWANFLCGLAFLGLGLWREAPLAGALVLVMLAGLFGVSYAVLIAHARLFMPAHVIGRGVTFVNFISIGGTGLAQLASGHAIAGMRGAGFDPGATYAALHLAFGALLVFCALVYAWAPARPAGR